MTANVSVSEYSEERKELFHGHVHLYYDSNNERIRTDDDFFDIPDFNERGHFTFLRLFREKVEYRLDNDKGTCEKVELTRPWQPIEVPSTAYYRGQSFVGVEGAVGSGLLANIWVGNIDNGRYAGLWTENCLPILDFYRSESDWRHWNLYDVQNVVDANMFNVPSQCQ
jgi:hypothetical protein